MAKSKRGAFACRIQELVFLCLCIVSVAGKKNDKVEWGAWGSCSVTCGAGQRSREGCKKDVKPGKQCPPGQVATETEQCSTVPCQGSSACEAVNVENINEMPDSNMTASSIYGGSYASYYGRLNSNRGKKRWCPKTKSDRSDYLQVDMGAARSVCAVATQRTSNEYTKTYYLQFSLDGVTWNIFEENNAQKNFAGSTVDGNVVRASLGHVVTARLVRFYPITYGAWPCLNVEIYQVPDIDDCAGHPCLNNGSCSDGVNNYTCACVAGYTGRNCSIDIDDCAGQPCKNGGTCSDGVNNYTCGCVDGYTGRNCDIGIDDCAAQPCKNGGSCSDGVSTYTCACVAGYTGRNCSIDIDDCAGQPCKNGGSCSDGVNTYTCACVTGYTGRNCNIDIDDCAGQPCKNGGTCSDGVNNYICACVAGYTGRNCSNDIDDCAGQPCKNGGSCSDGVNNYTCACVAGYTERNCSIDIDDCAGQPCKNGGSCSDGVNNYTCACVAGYTGRNCSIADIDDCAGQPCKNGGTCSDGVNNYTCACVAGYTGRNCSIVLDIDACAGQPCKNGGSCSNSVNNYTCACVAGYTGRNCSIDIDDCAGQPCKHGGSCSDGVNNYTCACVAGYTGRNCEIDIDDCAGQPCKNGGTCSDGVNNYTCACVAGYTGRNCSISGWGEWGACSVTCGAGRRSRERCSKNVKPGETCPPVDVTRETEKCSTVPCSSSTFQDNTTSLRGYFTIKKDWVLLNHEIKDIWASSEISCAMFCLRDPTCQSVNFKSTSEDQFNQQKSPNAKTGTPNCGLNAAKHFTHPKDFIPRKGYCYFHVT